MGQNDPSLFLSFLAGGSAGFCVDVILYPLDTIKTRLQSAVGFKAAGGFQNIYSGLGPAALGSAPNAALFFFTYESSKHLFRKIIPEKFEFCNHASAASVGEIAACLIRVPTEVLKQRRQTSIHSSSLHIFRVCFRQEGILGLYRGYWSTVMREIPFSFIQYPLWEYFKKCWIARRGTLESWMSSLSGALAGGISAALTTPLDVAKTRIILADHGTTYSQGKIIPVLKDIYKEAGVRRLFSGMVPRSLWMSLGGGIYFGVYEFITLLIRR